MALRPSEGECGGGGLAQGLRGGGGCLHAPHTSSPNNPHGALINERCVSLGTTFSDGFPSEPLILRQASTQPGWHPTAGMGPRKCFWSGQVLMCHVYDEKSIPKARPDRRLWCIPGVLTPPLSAWMHLANGKGGRPSLCGPDTEQ